MLLFRLCVILLILESCSRSSAFFASPSRACTPATSAALINTPSRCTPGQGRMFLPQAAPVFSLQAAGDDGWMFVDAKGFNQGGASSRDLELEVIARPFGDSLIPGDELWLDISKASEQLLVERAHSQGRRLAYTVGRSSTSGKFANAQGFLAGTTASLLSVREIQRVAGTSMSCRVRVDGRVVINAVKTMSPVVVAASIIRDVLPETQDRWQYLEKLKAQVVGEAEQIQALRRSVADNALRSKLNTLQKTAFLVDIPDEQYRDLVNHSASVLSDKARGSAGQEHGRGANAGDVDQQPIMERCFEVCGWMSEGARYKDLAAEENALLMQAEVLSFLALRLAEASPEALEGAIATTEAWSRLVIGIELLEHRRARLAAMCALSQLE